MTTGLSVSKHIRRLDGLDLPAAGSWVVDPGHADVSFTGRHLMLTRVRGRFTAIDGSLRIGEDPNDSEVQVTIDVGSLDSGDATRDEHLRSADLFDVAAHPTALFRSTAVRLDGPELAVDGDLTIKGVTRQVRLEGAYLGITTDPWGNVRAVFEAHTRLTRDDWGLTWNLRLDTGGLLVSREIDVDISFEALPAAAAAA